MLVVMSALSFKYAAAGNMGGGKNGKKSRRPNKFIQAEVPREQTV